MIGRQTGAIHLGQPVNWASPLNRGLVSWWLAIPQGAYFGGARFLDLCGRNHGTLTNAPTWGGAKGRPGGWGSLSFVKASIQYATHTRPFSAVDAFSVSMWLCPTATPGDFDGLWGLWDSDNNQFARWNGGGIQWFASNSANTATANITTSAITVNAWQHLVFVADGSDLRCYVNGVAGATAALTGPYIPGTGGTTWEIGKARSLPTDITVDDFAYHNRALSAADAVALWNESSRFRPTTLNRIRMPLVNSAGAAPANTKRRDLMLLGVGC